jgi:ribonucleotide monophosphatase NagD (HAD superfamily)
MPGNGSFLSAISTASGRVPDIITGKPNPDGLQLILETYGLDPTKV